MPDQLINGVGTLVSILTGLGLWKGGQAVVNRYSQNGQPEQLPNDGNSTITPEICRSQHEIVETKLVGVQGALDKGGERMETMTITLQEIKDAQVKNNSDTQIQLAKLNGKLRQEIDSQIDSKFDKLEDKGEKNIDRHEKRFHPVS